MMMLRPLALAALLACACSSEEKEAEGTKPTQETGAESGTADEGAPEGEASDESGTEGDEAAEEGDEAAEEGDEAEGDEAIEEDEAAEEDEAEEDEGDGGGESDEGEGGHSHEGHSHGPPKNLKILPKGWSRDKLTAFMKDEVNRGLGVKCKFCHVKDDYASDKKESKREARQMMRMQRAMNRKYFGGKPKVTCFTCHKGKKQP